jgi:hypothetical protein
MIGVQRMVALLFAFLACGGVASGTIRLEISGVTRLRVSPDGAIVLDKERIATLADGGKVIDREGRVLAWVYAESIRLAGGAQLPIREADDGTIHIPITAQEQAGLKAVRTRVSPTGDVVTDTGGRTRLRVLGVSDARDRRIGLLLLLLLANPPEGAPRSGAQPDLGTR